VYQGFKLDSETLEAGMEVVKESSGEAQISRTTASEISSGASLFKIS
jgi:hypothetical protein